MRALVLGVLLALSACATPPPPLMVEADGSQARVAIVGGPSMVLPSAGDSYYSNGRYGFRGGGAEAQWEVGRAAPVSCRGS
jgi:hypothetical protein